MPRAVIVGGGISGLAAAFDLTRAGVDCTILEKQSRPGGVIGTCRWEDCLIECGPDSFLGSKPEAAALIQELGLADQVIGSNDGERATYILKRGRLVRLPDGVMMIAPTRAMPLLKSPLLGARTKLRMALEMFRRPGPGTDRSIAEFVVDHFGRETLDYLAEPLLAGVYGGDPGELSAASVLPRFLEMEKRYGSLARGAFKSARGRAAGGPLFRTLKGGMGTLADALASQVNVRQGAAETIESRAGRGFRVRVAGGWMEAEQVVIAGPAWVAAELVAGVDTALAEALNKIPYTSSLLLTLVYRASEFDGRRTGFGFLIPKRERGRIAAGTFAASKFPFRAPAGRIVLRCFMGGASDEAAVRESDSSILEIARQELRGILGLTASPLFHTISRWPRAMAQYNVGHAARVREIQERMANLPGLHLAGNAYDGIGIPDCIRTGRAAAREIVTGSAVRAIS